MVTMSTSHFGRIAFLSVFLVLICAPAVHAEPYSIAYESDVFPEEDGWDRNYGEDDWPPESFAERSIEDGVFVLDLLHDDQIYDYYQIEREIDPDEGETFIAERRVKVDLESGVVDTGLGIAHDWPPGKAEFHMAPDGLFIGNVVFPFAFIPYEPGLFHAFVFRSGDMQSFELELDGSVVYVRLFEEVTLLSGRVGFGDGAMGDASRESWDYVRFGAVPEPASFVITALYPSPTSVIRHTLRRIGFWPRLRDTKESHTYLWFSPKSALELY